MISGQRFGPWGGSHIVPESRSPSPYNDLHVRDTDTVDADMPDEPLHRIAPSSLFIGRSLPQWMPHANNHVAAPVQIPASFNEPHGAQPFTSPQVSSSVPYWTTTRQRMARLYAEDPMLLPRVAPPQNTRQRPSVQGQLSLSLRTANRKNKLLTKLSHEVEKRRHVDEKADQTTPSELVCLMCCEHRRRIVFKCGHLTSCIQCTAQQFEKRLTKCSICSTQIEDFLFLYTT